MISAVLARLREVFSEPAPSPATPNDLIWHRAKRVPWFHKTADGKDPEMFGQVWRRWDSKDGFWEYKQDAETLEQFGDRQW